MSDDLVKRLRWLVSEDEHVGAYWEELEKAADEIDRLKAEIHASKQDTGYVIGFNAGWDEAFPAQKEYQKALDALKAKNARLMEALAFYANPAIYKPHPHGSAFDRRINLYERARAALEGKS